MTFSVFNIYVYIIASLFIINLKENSNNQSYLETSIKEVCRKIQMHSRSRAIASRNWQFQETPTANIGMFTPALCGAQKKDDKFDARGVRPIVIPRPTRWLSVNAITSVTTYGGIE